MSNESEIREATRIFLEKKYKKLELIDEFTQWNIPVRPDLFGATKNKIISIEIKSDKDSFARIDRQLLGYVNFSSSIYIALDHSHIERFLKNYGENGRFNHIGILSFKKGKISIEREATDLGVPPLYKMLWSQELYNFFGSFQGRSKIPKDHKTLSELIENIFTYREIMDISKKIFLSRIRNKDIKDLFENVKIEDRQKAFDEYLKEENWTFYNNKRSTLLI